LSHPTQLPDPYAVLTRILPLLKPGGWLLIEAVTANADVQGDVPGIRAAFTALIETFKRAGQELRYAAKLGAFLRETGVFGVVEAQHVAFPVNPLSDGAPRVCACVEPRRSRAGRQIRSSASSAR
jgi:hypothetical protein